MKYTERTFTVPPPDAPPRDPKTCAHWWTKRGCYWCNTPRPITPADDAQESR